MSTGRNEYTFAAVEMLPQLHNRKQPCHFFGNSRSQKEAGITRYFLLTYISLDRFALLASLYSYPVPFITSFYVYIILILQY